MDDMELGKILGRIEQQGKSTYDLIKNHIDKPCVDCQLEVSMSSVETNIKWIKRIGTGIIAAIAGGLGINKWLGG
jgi:hypothetical protein